MSGKQDKRLRKAALGLALSLDEAGKKISERTLLAKEHKRPKAPLPVANEAAYFHEGFKSVVMSKSNKDDGMETYAITAYNRPDSLRGIIQTIKKGLKSGKLPAFPR